MGENVELVNFNWNEESGMTTKSFNLDGIDDYIKIIQEKMEVERIKQLESEMAQTYDPRQQAKILQEIINSKEKE
mgnify:CR=1 FL=1